MAKISGIYVEIRGDSTQLRKDLATARQHVTEQATGMSNALNNALSPAQLKNNINGIVRNLNTLSQASKLTGNEFGAIGADLKDLQRLTGLSEKAFRDLQSRMIQTSAAKAQETALRNIAMSANLSAKEVSQLGKQMGVSASSIAAVNGAAKSSANSMTMLGSAAKSALGFMSVYTVIEFGRAIMDAGLAMDSLQRSFVAVTGSQAAAAETLSFLREEAGRLGQNFYALAPEFKNVMAAARGTAMEGENVRKMFSAIAGASTALGLSADDTHGALRALQQMMSKGKIQAEELRGQLGERLPGALNLMAKAMGVSTAELNKMMEDGKLLADEALPKLTLAIEKMYGAAAETAALESAPAAVNRLSQEWTEFKINLFDNEAAVNGINAITNALRTLTEYAGLRSVSDTFAQGAGLADKGLIDFDVFKAADFLERQRMVDEFLNTSRVAAKNFTATWAAAEKQSLESFNRYNERKTELASEANAKELAATTKAAEEFRKLTQTEISKLDERRDAFLANGVDRAKVEAWYTSEVAKLNEKSTKKFTSEQKKQVDEHKKAREAMRKNEAETLSAIDKWMEDYEQQQIEAVANGVAERKKLREDEAKAAADAAQKIADEQQAAAQKVMDNIQDATADVFYDMFQDIDKGWENLWDSMKSWALRTLAELAARAATVQIVVPIMTSMTGTANATQAVTAMTGQGNGGIMDLLTNMPTGGSGSLLESLPGGRYVSDALAYQLPGTATALAGSFGGVGAAAGTYATGLGFSSGAVANGALEGMSLGGASLSASAPAMTGGLSLGSAMGMGSLGGLGYSLLGGALGMPQSKYSGLTASAGGMLGAWGASALAGAAGGAAAGATAGSVVPVIGTVIGAIIGGLAGSMLGGKEQSPSVIFQSQQMGWGNVDPSSYQYHTKDGGEGGMAIAEQLAAVAGGAFQQVEAVVATLGEQYVDILKASTVEWGRKAGGSWKEWDFGADHDMQELLEKASADLSGQIYKAASGAFQAAGQDMAAGDEATAALGMLTGKAAESFKALQDVVQAGVQSGDVETYVNQLQAFQLAIATVNQTWAAVSQASAELVTPLTQYEQAQRAINNQYDAWIAQLEALGIAEAQLSQIEADRGVLLARLDDERRADIANIVQQAQSIASPMTKAQAAAKRLNDQFDELIAQLHATGAAASDLAAVEASRQTALDAVATTNALEVNATLEVAEQIVNPLSPEESAKKQLADKFDSLWADLVDRDAGRDELARLTELRGKAFENLEREQASQAEAPGNAVAEEQAAAAAKLASAWADVSRQAQDAANPLTSYALAVRELSEDFDGWKASLAALGIDAAKMAKLDEWRAQALARLAAENEAHIAQMIADASAIASPMTAVAGALRDTGAQFDDLAQQLVQAGATAAQLAQVEESRAVAMERVRAEYAKQIDDAMGRAANLAFPLTELESAIASVNSQFDDLAAQLVQAGASADQLASAEQYRAQALANVNINSAAQAVDDARNQLRESYRAEAAQLEENVRKWDSIADSLRGWRRDILSSDLSPIRQGEQAKAAFDGILARAKLGDEEAIGQLQGVAEKQLSADKDAASTAEDYARSAWRTLSEVEDVESVASRHASISQQQLDEMTRQVSELIAINDSVLSVREAISELAAAIAAQAAAQAAAKAAQPAGGDATMVSQNPPPTNQPAPTPAGLRATLAEIASAAGGILSLPNGGSVTSGWISRATEPLLEKIAGLAGVKGFAAGGMHSGGLRLVGENGPELEVTGPSRIWNAEDTKALLSGGGNGTTSEVRALRDDLRAIGRALAKNTADTARMMQRWDGDGMPEVRTA